MQRSSDLVSSSSWPWIIIFGEGGGDTKIKYLQVFLHSTKKVLLVGGMFAVQEVITVHSWQSWFRCEGGGWLQWAMLFITWQREKLVHC